MSLTPKQQRFVDEYPFGRSAKQVRRRICAHKISACRLLMKHMGMVESWATEAELDARAARYPGVAEWCALRILDQDAEPVARAAAGLMLEYFIPDWRKLVPAEMLGMVVDRNSNEVRQWRDAVLERDGYACVKCESTENLHAHHVVRWADSPTLRVVLENGMTLCRSCHGEAHGRTW